MKQAILLAILTVVAFASTAHAQKAEVFAGYQYSHLDPGFNASGFNGSVTGNFAPFLGVTADISGVYNSGTKFYTYTFGPEIHAPLPFVKPFAHALFGGATVNNGSSSNGFAMYVGGGLDVGHGLIGWRVIQADWLHTRFNGFNDNKNTRISTGLLLRF